MDEKLQRDLEMARRIAEAVAREGGRVYYVGGYVRDLILKRSNKDIDIEVHGVTPEQLRTILSGIGQLLEMGASFGVFGLRGCDIDIAMPRIERSTGAGHRDFDAYVDPFLGTRKAAERRDFTMNALMQDVLTGEIVDHFGGLKDIDRKCVRHVNDESFCEDPLRVLRAAQFSARFGFTVAEETVRLCSTLDLSALSHERIMGEVQKALKAAEHPSIFFECMREMGQLDVWFPELKALIGVPQDPRYHAEGDVWNHTMLVLDQAALLRSEAEYPEGLMMSALAHDMGKPLCTTIEGDRIHAYAHETEGIPIAERFVTRICNEVKLLRYVLSMVELHMQPLVKAVSNASVKSTNHMYDRSVCPEDLVLMSLADDRGRVNVSPREDREIFLRERLRIYKETMALPYVMGRDLVAQGIKPDRRFSEYLEYAHKLRLARVPYEYALKQTLALIRKEQDNAPNEGADRK